MSKKGKEYKKQIHALYASDDMETTSVPLKVRIELFPPDKRTRDFDNYVKPILDGLKWLELIEDDSQIQVGLVIKHPKITRFNKGLVLVYLKEDVAIRSDREYIIDKYMKELNFGEDEMSLFHTPKAVKK